MADTGGLTGDGSGRAGAGRDGRAGGRRRPVSAAARGSLERQRRDRTGKEQQRRRSHDHPTRAWREALDRGNQPCGHDSRVGMEPRRPRPSRRNSDRSRTARAAFTSCSLTDR